jgi:hypothetical protein
MAAILAALRRRSRALLAEPEAHRLQILVSEVDHRGPKPRLAPHGYRLDAEYVYPASAIKPFVAAAALRLVAKIAAGTSPPVTVDTPLCFGVGRASDCSLRHDRFNRDGGTITVRHEIRKMLLVSDNAAFGRLYDLVGRDGLYEALDSWGFDAVRIRHRMGGSEADGRRAPAVTIGLPVAPLLRIEARESRVELGPTPAQGLAVGRTHISEAGEPRDGPRHFGDRNFASVRDLHRMLVALVEPALAPDVSLDLPESDRRWLVEVMGTAPEDSPNPRYAGARFAERPFRPLLTGLTRRVPRAELDYVNKAGRAYGFMVENAYLRYRPTDRALFVTVALYVDDDGVVGDDRYNYDDEGTPLLEDLGEALARLLL